MQASPCKIPELLKSEKENRRGHASQKEKRKKEVQEELQSSRKKKERLEKMVQELTKEAEATEAETKHKMDLLVKSNAMHSKSHEKRKEIENEEKNIDGLQKKLKLM